MSAERNLTRRVRAWLDAQDGVWSAKIAGGPRQRRGIPDLIGCCRGKFFAIELKAPGTKPTPSQVFEIEKLKRAGARTRVARTLEDVQDFFRSEVLQ